MLLVFNFTKKNIFLSLLLVLWMPVAEAFLPSAFRCQFTQEEKSLVSGKIKKSEGQIEYRQPGRIRFEIMKPHQIIFVGNPKRTWYYTAPPFDGEPGEVTISNGAQHPILKFFDVLSKGLVKNESYDVTKKDGIVTLTFTKAAKEEFGLKSAVLTMGQDYTFLGLNKISVTLSDGKTIELFLTELKPNVALPETVFRFEIPANTRQNRQ
ncbi:MAG: hypothetical protein COW01_06365 [Bdellovibrionales bacterium CG12_big_fil_rev_8_21_14_0_65_38_15]|nr:MAG: hypothetical protein COW79_10445 [Bdellovibrionales bacterium CG22_combo_CG10-13_8_21_14_all_38_13]PIQ55813.1 MAG: hypothetical protein COW01_06365 [Bdellovibrionales bacterium CG12_big_fil_rev_8_21_14_0_65_38_15]PIR28717.1 MAG: hypothetical protein COV38_14350 [Bdellovibrionales bacterium CG11_big_fil_rev_8_21_14_0_20_38_13]